MTSRTVTGTVYRTTGTPWESAVVYFRLAKGSYTPETQYPKDTVYCVTDSLGRLTHSDGTVTTLGISLWCNEEGIVETTYECILPDKEVFSFTLSVGMDSVDLSILRNYGVLINHARIRSYFSFGDVSPVVIAPNFTGLLYSTSIIIRKPFNGLAFVSLGDAVDRQRLIASDCVDVGISAQYQTFPDHEYTNTDILLTISIDGATTEGTGIVILEI